MRRPSRKHVGCVVAVALAGVMVAVGVTGVSRIRHAAGQSQCHNNFKQILIAAQNYADVNGTHPPAAIPHAGLPVERRISWLVALVPYVESTDLMRHIDKTAAWDDSKNAILRDFALNPYRCPVSVPESAGAVTTYAGVTGVGVDSPMLPVDHPRAGVFGYDRGTPKGAIKDGESNTILVMEYGHGPVPWARGGEGTVAWFDQPPHAGPDLPFGTPHRCDSLLAWRQSRCGLVGFVDGSVRVIRDTVSPGVLEAMATVAGGEAVSLPE